MSRCVPCFLALFILVISGAGGDTAMDARADEDETSAETLAGAVVGQVMCAGRPRRAEVSVHLAHTIDPVDPYHGYRGFDYYSCRLRPAAVTLKPIAAMTTDDEGRFRVEGLAPGVYAVRALGADGAQRVSPFVVPVEGATIDIRLHLPTAHRVVAGRALRADGKPFRGFVEVTPTRPMWDPMAPAWGGLVAPTDAEGRFRITGAPKAALDVWLSAPGRLRYRRANVTVPLGDELTIRLPEDGPALEGRIQDEKGNPLPEADVVAWSFAAFEHVIQRVAVDEHAAFHADLPAGSRGAAIGLAGWWSAWKRVGNDEQDPIPFTLHRAGHVRGVVINRKGQPVGGARVCAFLPCFRPPVWFPRVVLADAKGAFELGALPPMETRIAAIGNGWWSPALREGTWLPHTYDPFAWQLESGKTTLVRIEAERLGRVQGRITTPDGEPIRGALVRTVGPGPRSRLRAQRWLFFLDDVDGAASNASGHYALEDVEPGASVRLLVKAPGHPLLVTGGVRVAAGATATHDVRLPAGRWVTLSVFDPVDGNSIVDARVDATCQVGRLFPGDAALPARTNEEGTARIGPFGDLPVAIRVQAAGFSTVRQEWDPMVEDESSASLDVPMHPPRTVTGQVVTLGDVPVDGVGVSLEPPGFMNPDTRVRMHRGGRFEVIDAPSSRMALDAWLEWQGRIFTGQAVVGPDATTVEITVAERVSPVRPKPNLHVRVLGPNGEPVPVGRVNLRATLEGSRDHHDSAEIEQGVAALALPENAKQYWLSVVDLGHPKLVLTVQGPFEAASGERTVVLEPGRFLTGLVRHPNGDGVRGVMVELSSTDELGSHLHWARTDNDGHFSFPGLAPGDIQLVFHVPPEYLEEERRVRIGGEPVIVDLRRACEARIRVVDEAGHPIEGARLSIEPANEGDAHEPEAFASDADGRIHVRGLEPGTHFTLRIEPPHDRDELLDVVRAGWSPADEEIRLLAARMLTGRLVREGDGEGPRVHFIKWRLVGEGRTRLQHVEPDGTFEIYNLPPGEVEIEASAHSVEERVLFECGPVRVRTDAKDVVLVLRRKPFGDEDD